MRGSSITAIRRSNLPKRNRLAVSILALGLGASMLVAGSARAADVCARVEDRLERLETLSGAGVTQIGRSRHGRPIKAVILTEPSRDPSSYNKRTRVLVISGQHGNEPTPVRAALDICDQIAVGSREFPVETLSKCVVAVIPIVNPDGFSAHRRLNAAMSDLNRDWACATQPETASVLRFIKRFRPEVVIDMHEWTSDDPHTPDCIEAPAFGDTPQNMLARRLSAYAFRAGQGNVLPLKPIYYGPECDNRLAHRALLSRGICAFLVETDPDEPAAVRVGAYASFVRSVLDGLMSSPDPTIAQNLAALRKSSRCEEIVASAVDAGLEEKPQPQRKSKGNFTLLVTAGAACLIATAACSKKSNGGAMQVCAVTSTPRSLSEIASSDLSITTKRTMMRQRPRASDRQK